MNTDIFARWSLNPLCLAKADAADKGNAIENVTSFIGSQELLEYLAMKAIRRK